MRVSPTDTGEEGAAQVAAPSYPPFYTQHPYGAGGPEIEAFTSYVTRLANRHSIPSTVLLKHARLLRQMQTGATNRKPPSCMHHSINGYGPRAQELVDAMAAATHDPGVLRLTLLPWRGAFAANGQGLLGNHLAWCTQCWREDLARGLTPYVRLYWLLKCVSSCRLHETPLTTACPNCKSRRSVLPVIPRFQICSACGTDVTDDCFAERHEAQPESNPLGLGGSALAQIGTRPTAKEAGRRLWYARNTADLIGKTCAGGREITTNAAKQSLEDIYKNACGGSAILMKALCGQGKVAVYHWRSGKTRPQFQVFAEVSYQLQIPLSSLLVDADRELDLCSRALQGPTPCFTNRRMDSEDNRRMLAERIRGLGEDPNPPCSLAALARRARTSTETIRYRFPDEARAVIEAGKRAREAAWEENADRRARRVAEACRQLMDIGEYPTARKISSRFQVVRSEFRKPHIQAVLRQHQIAFTRGE